MQRIFNIDKWTRLSEGQGLEFSNPRPRNVRVEVNAPSKAAIYCIDGDGEAHFLALVEGRDTIEFGSTGAFTLSVEGPDVMIYTADGADISSVVVAPVVFTKIIERRRRNPELEHIAAVMARNMERRLEQQADEIRRQFERREALLRQPPDAGVPQGTGGQSAPADDAGASNPPAAPADAGAGAGGSGTSAP